MRHTSRKIFDQIVKNGSLSKARLDVYELLLEQTEQGNPVTAEELRSIARKRGYKNWVHFPKRLSELERTMAIESTQKRKCRITGNEALTWRVTGLMPIHVKLNNTTTVKERKKQAMDYAGDLWNKIKENKLDNDERGLRFLNLIQKIRDI